MTTDNELDVCRKIAFKYSGLMLKEIAESCHSYEGVMYAIRNNILLGCLYLKMKYNMTDRQISELLIMLEDVAQKDIITFDVKIDKNGIANLVKKAQK